LLPPGFFAVEYCCFEEVEVSFFFLLLAIGYWLLAIGYWLLAIGYWLLPVGYWLLAIGCCLLSIVAASRFSVRSSPPSASS
jgi:hypothetical protein